jgi:hypothetical protein
MQIQQKKFSNFHLGGRVAEPCSGKHIAYYLIIP